MIFSMPHRLAGGQRIKCGVRAFGASGIFGVAMKLTLASSNRHKFDEMSCILSEFGIRLEQKSLGIPEPDLGSVEQVAQHKACEAFAQIRGPVIAEDTGVFFDAYNDFPGLMAKRVYLGIGFPGLLALINAAEDKGARFRTAVCYCDGKAIKTFTGELAGRLLTGAVSIGKDRLPYEKIFMPVGHSCALVDLPLEEKNKISHRAKATRKLGEWLATKTGR